MVHRFVQEVFKIKKKKHFDRESKNPKQKRIKSKPIQQKNLIKSNMSNWKAKSKT